METQRRRKRSLFPAHGLEVNLSRHDAVVQRRRQGDVVLLGSLEEVDLVLARPGVERLLHQPGLLLLEGLGDVQRTLETKEPLRPAPASVSV